MFNTEVPRSVTRLSFKPSLFWLQKVLLIVVTLLCFTLTANADDNQKKLEDLKKTIAELQRSLSAQNKEKTELEISLKAVEVEASNLATNIRSLHVKITREEAELKDKADEKHELEQSINQQSDAIIEQLRSAHKLGVKKEKITSRDGEIQNFLNASNRSYRHERITAKANEAIVYAYTWQ